MLAHLHVLIGILSVEMLFFFLYVYLFFPPRPLFIFIF